MGTAYRLQVTRRRSRLKEQIQLADKETLYKLQSKMPETDDPRRPSYTTYMNHRIGMTKKKSREIELGIHRYIYETSKVSSAMDKFANVFSVYGTEESGETGAMLRAFGMILNTANAHRTVQLKMLSDVGANLRHLKGVYRDAREALKDYKETCNSYEAARKKYVAARRLMRTGKSVRKAKCVVERRESELFLKRRELKKALDEFEKMLRKALLGFFFQFVKCEMYMAARMLETFSESNSKLERWRLDIKEMKEWVAGNSIRKEAKG